MASNKMRIIPFIRAIQMRYLQAKIAVQNAKNELATSQEDHRRTRMTLWERVQQIEELKVSTIT